MKPKATPQAKPQDRILDAALSVFRRHGFRRSSIEQAAETAGLTRQALYHYFSSKEALFRAVLERLYANALAAEIAAAKAAEDNGGSLADIIIAEIEARFRPLIASFDGSPHIEELFSEHLTQAKDVYQAFSARYSEEIASTIARVSRKQKLTLPKGVSARDLARMIEMAVHGTKSAYPAMLPVDAFLKQLKVMVRMLIAGAIASPARPQAKTSRRKTETRT
jgi:AcrR family transcriptional regulator